MNEKELEKIYKSKLQKKSITKKGYERITAGFVETNFADFKNWFESSNFEKGCHYCGTKNSKSNDLYNLQRSGQRYDATRGGKRGRRLELDRKDPSLHYDKLDNIVWCCYWCNNAKSNFFSVEEFEPIAKAIGEVINKI